LHDNGVIHADHPAHAVSIVVKDDEHDRLEAIAVTLVPSDVVRAVLAARA
jgi:hypothetical protein